MRWANSPRRCVRHVGEPMPGRASWPVSRILFPAAISGGEAATIHLGHPSPGASSGLPASSGEQPSNACATAPPARSFGLASGGVCRAIPVTRDAGALLPHRFTLTTARMAVCFLWHFPAGHPGLPLATTLLCEVRTFLDAPLVPKNQRTPRPPGQLVRRKRLYPLRNSGSTR
jgi:hypothetical protein